MDVKNGTQECDPRCTLNWSLFTEEVITEYFIIPQTDLLMSYVIIPIIVCFGLLSNISFLITFMRTKWMHSRLYFYLVHLALVDTSALIFAYTQRLITLLITPLNVSNDAFGEFGCIAALIIDMLYNASIIIVATISLERYLAICHPLRHLKGSTSGRIVMVFILTWVFSFAVAFLQLPQGFYNQLYCVVYPEGVDRFEEYPRTLRLCTPIVSWYGNVYAVLQLTVFYTCLFINLFCGLRIVMALSKREVVESSDSQRSGGTVKNSQTSATRMILVNGSVYFFCNSPIHLLLTLTLILRLTGNSLQFSQPFLVTFFRILQSLIYVNLSINPIIYSVTNARYRAAFFKAFCSGSKKTVAAKTSNNTLLTSDSKL